MNRAGIVHMAVHGDHPADSPLFSSRLLADGPLTVCDIERLRAVPRLVVLSACDDAVADVRTGGELLGTASAFLCIGRNERRPSRPPVATEAAGLRPGRVGRWLLRWRRDGSLRSGGG
jgi:hypothetical protein